MSTIAGIKAASVTDSAELFDPRLFFDKELSNEEIVRVRRALLYRSRQTGWLETDVIMVRYEYEIFYCTLFSGLLH